MYTGAGAVHGPGAQAGQEEEKEKQPGKMRQHPTFEKKYNPDSTLYK